ncbi:hypothetical protein HK405_003000, partial [Cladochytrium tenue]
MIFRTSSAAGLVLSLVAAAHSVAASTSVSTGSSSYPGDCGDTYQSLFDACVANALYNSTTGVYEDDIVSFCSPLLGSSSTYYDCLCSEATTIAACYSDDCANDTSTNSTAASTTESNYCQVASVLSAATATTSSTTSKASSTTKSSSTTSKSSTSSTVDTSTETLPSGARGAPPISAAAVVAVLLAAVAAALAAEQHRRRDAAAAAVAEEAERVRCVRFAPSPTGALHLGGLRTALFNQALARGGGSVGGSSGSNARFILRIEDTDRTRTVPGAAEDLIEMLRWAGVRWDEERLAGLRRASSEGYDQHCRYLDAATRAALDAAGTPYTIRMKIPVGGSTTFMDLVQGRLRQAHGTIDDAVLLKSDGRPTYHLASCVDDRLMGVSHVVRGAEWVPSTAKHVLLHRALARAASGAGGGGEDGDDSMPVFAHLPLLTNLDGSKLSKRHGSRSIRSLK